MAEVYDKYMEVLEKEGNYKNAAKLHKQGGSEDYGSTLTMNFLILNSNEFSICLYSFSTKWAISYGWRRLGTWR